MSQTIHPPIEEKEVKRILSSNHAYYFEPVNLNQWNMFEKVRNVGHVEPFLATKEMHKGDIMLLHVGAQKKDVKSGIYAIAEIISNPFILKDSPDDYCNNKNTVRARIILMKKDTPIFLHDECLSFIRQFRTAHKIDMQHYVFLNSVLGKLNAGCHEVQTFPDEIPPELAEGIFEGAVKKVAVNYYERDKSAREKCIAHYLKREGTIKCQICGFDFGKIYGAEYEGMIHVHHVVPLSTIKKEYKVNPVKDLIPVCPNCHMVLHSKSHPSVEELKIIFKDIQR